MKTLANLKWIIRKFLIKRRIAMGYYNNQRIIEDIVNKFSLQAQALKDESEEQDSSEISNSID